MYCYMMQGRLKVKSANTQCKKIKFSLVVWLYIKAPANPTYMQQYPPLANIKAAILLYYMYCPSLQIFKCTGSYAT